MNLDEFKTRYKKLQETLKDDFLKSPELVEDLVVSRSNKIDSLLKDIWQGFDMSSSICLVAVGGYGRSELHLYSDIDLLILIPNNSHNKHKETISKFFVTFKL